MQIKHAALAQYIQKKMTPVYLLTGQDNFLLEDALYTIKSTLKKAKDCEEKILSIQTTEDWNEFKEEANSYSLFSETVIITIHFDKKSFDASAKKILTEYLDAVNSRCCVIIRAPNVPAKQLLWLSNHDQVTAVIAYPMNEQAMKSWIVTQFKKNALQFDMQLPDLIYLYTQGNMLACAQAIEKIALTYPQNSTISLEQAKEHLSDQSEHSNFELIDACLLNQADKAIKILRQAANNKTEATLILWMLTQEVRLLLQLSFLIQQNIDIKTACSQLKIWPQRMSLYQMSLKRFNMQDLRSLLLYCQTIDARIKSSFNAPIWPSLENLALSLSIGKLIGELCEV